MLMSNEIISRLALPLASARTVEELTRTVLSMMELYIGLESSYLAVVDKDNDLVRVSFSRNARKTLVIPEGTTAAWADTLCKRALEDPDFGKKLPDICNESSAARALGLKTYATAPVYLMDGTLYGMLCTVSREAKKLSSSSNNALMMFAKIIEQQVHREMLFKQVAVSLRNVAIESAFLN